MSAIIELKHVNKIFGTEIKNQVLYDINLAFEEGSFNSMIGQSGSGKSTLLNIIGTLDQASSGEVLIENQQLSKMTANQLADYRNQTIGFVFQFHYLLPEFTAIENVLIPYLIRNGKVNKDIINRANELLEYVGLNKVKNYQVNKMSGGQQQRTAIARALINNPKIILADEPTGNLDSDTTESIYDLLRSINEDNKTTFLIITHDRRVAEKTDRIVEIKDGRVYLDLKK